MAHIQGCTYIPAIRTRDSELKGYECLSDAVKDKLLPVFELTKSRRSPKNPDGSLAKTVERLLPLLNGRPFIVDVTSLESQGNSETADLLNPHDAFGNWRKFVRKNMPATCIPVVHLTDPLDVAEVTKQINDLFEFANAIALRVPPDYMFAKDLAQTLRLRDGMPGMVILLVDDGFVTQGSEALSINRCNKVLQYFSGKVDIAAPLTSCFPSSVAMPGFGGGDAYGEFKLVEVFISETLKLIGLQGARILHGDYALIHPNDFDGVVTNWVPRVDVPLDGEGFYHRYRREVGGYGLAARLAIQNPKYSSLKCWGDSSIMQAAVADPPGRSPSFWISVRVNYHITRQVRRLSPNVLL